MKTLVVGDIHGCYREFLELLDRSAIGRDDRIVAVGDLINKGPDSPRVVEFFRTHPNAFTIAGNHELKHISALSGDTKPGLATRIAQLQLGAAHADAVKWFGTLPCYLELPEAIVVHAFMEPGVALHKQKRSVLAGLDSGEEYLRRKGNWPWYKRVSGDKPVIVGHRDYESSGQPMVWNDTVFAIDTRCCDGFALTGLLLPDFQFVSVPAPRNYWADLKCLYKDWKDTGRANAEEARKMSWETLERAVQVASHIGAGAEMEDRHQRRLRETLEGANRRLEQLHRYLVRVGTGESAPSGDSSSGKKRKRGAKGELGHLDPLIESAREGQLSVEALKRRFRRPRDIEEIVSILGIQD